MLHGPCVLRPVALTQAAQNSQIQKAFIFDIATRIYLATDSSPVDPADYALAWDYVNTLRQLEPLYSPKGRTATPETWSTSVVRLHSSTSSTVIAYWQLNTYAFVGPLTRS